MQRSRPPEWFRLEPLYITVEITLAASSTGSCHHFDCVIRRRGEPSQIKLLAAPVCRTGAGKTSSVSDAVVTTGAVYEVLFSGSVDITGVE